MSLTSAQMDLLRKLSMRPLTVVDFKVNELAMAQKLAKIGYARDFGDQKGRRVPVRLRIWGITDAGRAAIQSQNIAEARETVGQSQLPLTLTQKEFKFVSPITTTQLAEMARQRKEVKVSQGDEDTSHTHLCIEKKELRPLKRKAANVVDLPLFNHPQGVTNRKRN